MAKTALISAVVSGCLVAAAFVLNPDADAHREAIKSAVGERNQLAGMLGLGALAALTSTYHPLGVASYTTVNGKTASWGAFGMVFVLDPEATKP